VRRDKAGKEVGRVCGFEPVKALVTLVTGPRATDTPTTILLRIVRVPTSTAGPGPCLQVAGVDGHTVVQMAKHGPFGCQGTFGSIWGLLPNRGPPAPKWHVYFLSDIAHCMIFAW
jgi:hypothetical protein